MKKIQFALVALLSILITKVSNAGELTVTGKAVATYSTGGTDASSGKAIGVANELDFTASGELDNGYTWKYQVQLDDATTANDDTRLEIGGDFGKIGIYASEGGLSSELAYGIGALGVGNDYNKLSSGADWEGLDLSDYGNIQYHTPKDLIPFGTTVKLGIAPNTNTSSKGLSAKESGTVGDYADGKRLEQIYIQSKPIDGLTITGDVARTAGAVGGTAQADDGASANLSAKYTIGQFSIGYGEGGYQDPTTTGFTTVYEKEYAGIQFDVNDALSVSYAVEDLERRVRSAIAAGDTTTTKTTVVNELESLQVAYTTGGMTLGIAQIEEDNADFTAGRKATNTIASVAIAF
jgi:outer membrane protein OmpU